ncbi:MAG TPA: NAD-dependent epimerase/dehydratase family protein [Actinomycetes bacterium]|jgi:UDP-glucose 4-epimerase|nr:NAD-dependent epimerase/dehydratase family protein [Actinomycetes bacterium]
MRVVVTGASGNVGTSLLRALDGEAAVTSVLGLARRRPELELAKTTWATADVAADDLTGHFRGADGVVHLAWLIQPSHDPFAMWRTNVVGTERVLAAASQAGVGAVVCASSVGAYSPGPKDRRVDEAWPTHGVTTSSYSRDKAYQERLLDLFERDHPQVRVVRLRPALTFKKEAASEIRRYFLGPLVPGSLARADAIPVVPKVKRLRTQAVHADDVAQAYRLAVVGDARGPFNLAVDPVLDADALAAILQARPVRVPTGLLKAGAAATWRLHLQPVSPGWLDLALQSPLLDAGRARAELGWRPRRNATETLQELLAGLREGAGAPTPPLDPRAGGPLRLGEFRTGVGGGA